MGIPQWTNARIDGPGSGLALTTFSSPNGSALRTLTFNGAPWFIAKDVCEVLGLTHPSSTIKTAGLSPQEFSQFNCGNGRPPLFITESGLYKFILRSRKPEARKFQDWVTSVVLPAIRKDGGYILGEEKVKTGEMGDDELLARALQVSVKKLERLAIERDQATALAFRFSARAAGLEPEDEVQRYRSLDDAADYFGLNLDHGTRCRLGQTLGQLDKAAGRKPHHHSTGRVFNRHLGRDVEAKGRRLYPSSAIQRALRIHRFTA